MQDTPLKKMPPLNTDEEAEAFLEEDLSEYDWSGFKRVQFRFPPKTEEVNLSLPTDAASALKKKAETLGLPYLQYLTQVLVQESAS